MTNKPKVTVQGYVSRSEMRYTGKGTPMLKFSIPVNAWSSKERDGYKPAYSGTGFTATAWNNFVMWGEKAENANQWIEKGKFVIATVEPAGIAENGTMRPKIYQGKASYDWRVLDVRLIPRGQVDIEQNAPPGLEEDNEIPF